MVHLEGDGEYEFDIVGESHYQTALAALAGPKNPEGVRYECVAELIPDPENPYDANAIRVEIDGRLVGHLARAQAAVVARIIAQSDGVRGFTADALIVGGWIRGSRSEGSYGVKLDISE